MLPIIAASVATASQSTTVADLVYLCSFCCVIAATASCSLTVAHAHVQKLSISVSLIVFFYYSLLAQSEKKTVYANSANSVYCMCSYCT